MANLNERLKVSMKTRSKAAGGERIQSHAAVPSHPQSADIGEISGQLTGMLSEKRLDSCLYSMGNRP
eukprot:scaffold151787_cov38-Prasinocladus_malaysianus.AAC.1